MVGILLLVVLFKAFGVKATLEKISEIGWGFWIITGIFFFTNIFLTIAWRILINYPLKGFHFHRFMLARLAGDSTTAFNALGAVAGEPLKAMYVRDFLPMKVGLASVVLDRTIKTISSILITLTGIIISLFVLKIPYYISGLTILICISSLIAMILLLKKQKQGFIEYLMEKLPGKFKERYLTESRLEKIKTLDDEIKFIFSSRDNLYHFYVSLFLHYTAIIISCTLEIYLIAVYLNVGGDFTMIDAFFIYVFGFILTSLMFFMPANVGTSEGSYSLALGMLGFNPSLGLSIGIIRRLRTFFWAGIGVLLLFYAGLMRKEDKSGSTSG
jgi:hypothetical protein